MLFFVFAGQQPFIPCCDFSRPICRRFGVHLADFFPQLMSSPAAEIFQRRPAIQRANARFCTRADTLKRGR